MGGHGKENIVKYKCYDRRDILCKGLLYAFTIGLFLMSYVRVFDNTFWGDEAYTIRLSQMNFLEMVRNTANDVHPPLYYLCVQMICKIFGHNNISYHLASIIPYGLLMIFSLRTIKKNFGTEASMIMMTMISIMDNAIVYNLEARMYSLGAMFLVFSFWEFYQILEKITQNIIFSLCCIP